MNSSFYESLILVQSPTNSTAYFVAEKAQLESEGHGGEKAYQVEAKRLLDSVIRQNKEEKAVSSPFHVHQSLILVERHCRISSRTIPRSSTTNGITRLNSHTDAPDRNILSRFPHCRYPWSRWCHWRPSPRLHVKVPLPLPPSLPFIRPVPLTS
jgi:hypothetical protein